jgi:hypothetical protein
MLLAADRVGQPAYTLLDVWSAANRLAKRNRCDRVVFGVDGERFMNSESAQMARIVGKGIDPKFTAVGYIRCGAQVGWSDLVAEERRHGQHPGRIWQNKVYAAINNNLRRYARKHKCPPESVFYEPEIDNHGRPLQVEFPDCKKLAELAIAVQDNPQIKTVLVVGRTQLAHDKLVLATLCKDSCWRGVTIVETESGN